MKSRLTISLCLFFFLPLITNAQIYTPSGIIQGSSGNNNVGFGEPNPTSRVHIRERAGVGLLLDAGIGGPILGGGYEYTTFPLELRWSDNTTQPPITQDLQFRMHNSGRIDVGGDFTSFPIFNTTRINMFGGFQIFESLTEFAFMNSDRLRWSNTGASPFIISFYDQNTSQDFDAVIISTDGRMSINAPNPLASYHLAVGGDIICEELTIKLQQDWPDYVFEPSYMPLTLYELDAYIKNFGHLPEIPTAEEVRKNGVDIGEMNALLLKKIEELTLELIKLRKEVDILQK